MIEKLKAAVEGGAGIHEIYSGDLRVTIRQLEQAEKMREALEVADAVLSNLGEPCSEPMNSAVSYSRNEDRRHFMGVIRRSARDASETIRAALSQAKGVV